MEVAENPSYTDGQGQRCVAARGPEHLGRPGRFTGETRKKRWKKYGFSIGKIPANGGFSSTLMCLQEGKQKSSQLEQDIGCSNLGTSKIGWENLINALW